MSDVHSGSANDEVSNTPVNPRKEEETTEEEMDNATTTPTPLQPASCDEQSHQDKPDTPTQQEDREESKSAEDNSQQEEMQVCSNQEKQKKNVPNSARHDIQPREMFEEMMKVSVPSLVATLFLFAIQTITMGFIGHRLGYKELAAYSIGVSVFNILGASIGVGVNGALETLAPQAFGRDKNTKELCRLMQRATLVNCILIIPIFFIFYSCEPVLVKLYGEELGRGAALFLRASPIYLIFFWTATVLYKLLAAQQLVNVTLMAYAVATPLAYFVNDTLLVEGSSVTQAVWNLCICQGIIDLIMLIGAWKHKDSILFSDSFPCEDLWDMKKLKEYSVIAAAAAASVCSEWWAFEVLQIVVAQLGEAPVAAFTVMFNVLIFFYAFASGISTGGATMLGNALGANEPGLAKQYVLLTAKCACCSMFSTSGTIYFFGNDIMKIYSKDEEVLGLVRPMVWLFASWQLSDAFQSVQQSLFRGAGLANRLAKIMLASLWLVGLPLAYMGGISLGYGLAGVVGGQTLAVFGLGFVLTRDVWNWDYVKLAEQAAAEEPEEKESVKEPAVDDGKAESNPTS